MKIKDLKINTNIEGFYFVLDKKIAETKSGSKYINMDLGDDTGKINGKIWNNAERFDSLFKKGEIVCVSAKVDQYKDVLQFNISSLRQITDNDNINLEDFLPKTKKSIDKMFADLKELLGSIKNKDLKKLVDLFMDDPKFINKFKKNIAAKSVHHNYIGGLLEHTLSVAGICDFFGKHYGHLDRDLLVAIAFFHDIGKLKELNSETFDYTVQGGLKGHIILGLEMLDEKFKILGPSFPEDLKLRIEHAIVSHHGELEWGAPVVPKTPEAIILHYADNVDAKTVLALTEIENSEGSDEPFTNYSYLVKRAFYKGLDSRPQTPDSRLGEEKDVQSAGKKSESEMFDIEKKQDEFLF